MNLHREPNRPGTVPDTTSELRSRADEIASVSGASPPPHLGLLHEYGTGVQVRAARTRSSREPTRGLYVAESVSRAGSGPRPTESPSAALS
jgi:hypothetical protein